MIAWLKRVFHIHSYVEDDDCAWKHFTVIRCRCGKSYRMFRES